jgi:hypothetical protein
MAATHVLNVDELLYWIGAIMAVGTLVTAIIVPLRKMLQRYSETLEDTQAKMLEQATMMEQCQMLIGGIQQDRETLNADIAAIKKATLTQIKLDINRIVDRALDRSYTYPKECEIVEMLFESYRPLGGNGVTTRKVEMYRQLKVKTENS